jgi:hypothetical protein
LSPLRRSRVGMKLYFPFHTLENVNIWKFITYKFEWREVCPLRMPRVLLCFLPNRGFVLERYGLLAPATGQQILDLFVHIVDLCDWPTIFLFLLAGLICSGGALPCSTGGLLVVVCDNLFLEVMILAIKSCKIICCFFFFTLQFGLNRAEICPSLDRFES